MTDTALADWLAGGAPVDLTEAEVAAKRASAFAQRFLLALNPPDDLGPTEELHQQAVAERVYGVHSDLNVLGEIEYGNCWALMAAKDRAAIKKYVASHASRRDEPASGSYQS